MKDHYCFYLYVVVCKFKDACENIHVILSHDLSEKSSIKLP